MKILLIYPYPLECRLQEDDIGAIPIGVYYVAALLKENGYDVEVLNWYNIDKTPSRVKEILREKNPAVIGFSILNANRWGGVGVARIAKQINPDVKIIFGGIGATFLWKHFLAHFPEIDFVVIGEGEHTFLNLVRHLEREEYGLIEDVEGLAFRKKGKIVRTGKAKTIKDLDSLPIPARYFTYQHVTSSRGCVGNCTFCGSPQLWGRRIRFHTPEKFVEQLELLCERGVRFFYVSDDTFTVDKKRVIEICKRILEKDLEITWFAISRVDCIDEEILYWMRRAGCIQISYGVEHGSERIRDILNKNMTTAQIKKAFALTQRYGIMARAYFIYGCPGETDETIQETIDLIEEIKPLSAIFYILDLFPGTKLYDDFCNKFKATDDIWSQKIEGIQYLETDPNLSGELILAFGKKLRTAFYEGLHRFVDSLDLIDDQELYPLHADFCSRLAMTFSHGDYSRIEAIRNKDIIAEKSFRKALTYFPDHRAYLGLGIILQKQDEIKESIGLLQEGVTNFPQSEQLATCLAISYMNAREFTKALDCLRNFQNSQTARTYIAACYRELGDPERAAKT